MSEAEPEKLRHNAADLAFHSELCKNQSDPFVLKGELQRFGGLGFCWGTCTFWSAQVLLLRKGPLHPCAMGTTGVLANEALEAVPGSCTAEEGSGRHSSGLPRAAWFMALDTTKQDHDSFGTDRLMAVAETAVLCL